MALNEGRSPDAANDFLCKVASDDRCWINNGGFALNGKTHMTGAQIRALPMPSIRDTDDLYMEVPGSEDVIVQYDEVVPVAGRRFFSVPSIINAGSLDAANLREIAVGGDGKTPILDSVTGEPIRVPCEPRSAAKCQECGGGRGDHGLGCPKGPHPMAGETMRFDPGSFDRAVRGVETRGRDHV